MGDRNSPRSIAIGRKGDEYRVVMSRLTREQYKLLPLTNAIRRTRLLFDMCIGLRKALMKTHITRTIEDLLEA